MSVALHKDSNADIGGYMAGLGRAARAAAAELAAAEPALKNAALLEIATVLDRDRDGILAANRKDLEAASADGLGDAMVERLELNPARIDAMIEGLHQVVKLADPVGEISELRYRPSGIQVGKMRVPLGVIGIIYESRPNVTVDAAALCLKSGNACILRGGKEALHSNQAIYRCIRQGLEQSGLVAAAVQVVNTSDREAVAQMLKLDDCIDVIIPRGGKSLIERIARESSIPVIKHLDGVCHVYIDEHADLDKALEIAVNSKTRRYGVCNAMETLLVDETVAARILPDLVDRLTSLGVELRGCERTRRFDAEKIVPAGEEDWYREYLAPVLSIRIVDGLEQAIEHINRYGSGHTDAIVSEHYGHARAFLRRVDSSSVMVNASTGFADGFE
ncbi:MAG: glutamate-5-semialdehyde dehydrogenase, partial [Gammaproteobacteria bacterium]